MRPDNPTTQPPDNSTTRPPATRHPATRTPDPRLRVIHDRPPASDGRYVLYWMLAARRSSWNPALDRSVDWARELGQPLLVLEALRADYRWASDRVHRFVLDGMRDNQAAFAEMGVGYFPYLESGPNDGRGLLAALAKEASVVVTDRSPVFDLPRLVRAATPQIPVRFEEVDGCGVLPLDAPPEGQVYPTAYAFRRFLQRRLPEFLTVRPRPIAVVKGDLPPRPVVSTTILERWPAVDPDLLDGRASLDRFAIDHAVAPVPFRGGPAAATARLATFLDTTLARYADDRSHPDDDAQSGLSPYLHFGHISAQEVVTRLLRREQWKPGRLAHTASGAKEGWWGASRDAESFLDELITWRELGFNMADRRPDFERYESLPEWAQRTLAAHQSDPRPHLYTLDQLDRAATADPVWNAAQRQLVKEGRIHNYLRMLWGKKILEWTPSAQEALAILVELNNRYSIDGRDPNSYSGIFWVLGRYDRPWPERPVYGTVRTMSSTNTVRKLRVKNYLRRFESSLF